ncbi:MAG: menaquinone biosynthesis protein [Phycisphaerae bacterium]
MSVIRLGVVSYLNARPLIEGLDADPRVRLCYDVPAALPGYLERGDVDVALVPVFDLIRAPRRFRIISDACIGCDGETMTVRVFSQVPPDRIRTLWVDPDSHTSVALARVLWRDLYDTTLALRPIQPGQALTTDCEAALLIGDKVVDPRRGSFAFEVDLGGAWRAQTGLPFVFAVWARLATGEALATADAETILQTARDAGVMRAAGIAAEWGPRHGWPVALAERYLVRRLSYRLTDALRAGARMFASKCEHLELCATGAAAAFESS